MATGTICWRGWRSRRSRLGVAETTAARLRAEPGVAQRELREADEDDYVVRAKPLSLGQVQALPVPGKLELGGDAELELIPTEGHTADGMAVWAPFAARAGRRRLRLAARDPDHLRERLAQRLRRDAAAAGALRRAGRVGRARPRRRRSTARAPWRSCARTSSTWSRSGAMASRRCRWRAATACSASSTRRTRRGWAPRRDRDPPRRAADPARRRGGRGRVLGVVGVLGRRAAAVAARRARRGCRRRTARRSTCSTPTRRSRRAAATSRSSRPTFDATLTALDAAGHPPSRARPTGARPAPTSTHPPATSSSSWPRRRRPAI